MDQKQFSEFVAVLKSCYPKDNMFGIAKVVEVWFKQLQDLDYGVAMVALNKWIATEKWPPSIADIRSLCVDVTEGNDTNDWSKAWEQVNKAIVKYGYYRPDEAYKELDKMNPLAAETVKRMGYCNLCVSDNQVADRANFRDIYCTLVKRKRQDAQIPVQLRLAIDEMQSVYVAGGNERRALEG